MEIFLNKKSDQKHAYPVLHICIHRHTSTQLFYLNKYLNRFIYYCLQNEKKILYIFQVVQ